MAPKKKAAAKKDDSESESDSSSDSSSSSSASDPAPKKGSSKKKAAPKAKENTSEEKAVTNEGGEEKPSEEKGLVFQPPPRQEFKPHTDYPPITKAEEVVYCPIDGLPADFCQYGPSWEKSKPWCMENFPHYYPELVGASLDEAKEKADEAQAKSKVKELPGGKKKRDKSPEVTIKKLTRSGRKCVTSIAGLEGFEVKLEGAAKLFKKKFACGCSVVKGENGQPDTVDLQGDCEQELVELIAAEYKIPEEKISMLEGGTKKKGKR